MLFMCVVASERFESLFPLQLDILLRYTFIAIAFNQYTRNSPKKLEKKEQMHFILLFSFYG